MNLFTVINKEADLATLTEITEIAQICLSF